MIAAQANIDKLSGVHILLVEDNFLVGTSIKLMLEELGCEVSGPAPSLERAKEMALEKTYQGALLDINIIGGTSAPIAELLQSKGCPVIFVTGYGSPMHLSDRLMKVRRLNKPVDANMLREALVQDFA